MSVRYVTFGCKANQYDTERMRQELEARGLATSEGDERAEVFVVNTCTVTHQADADARRRVRRIHRESPGARIVVAGCSAVLRPEMFETLPGVVAVVGGHDPVAVADRLAAPHALVPLTIRRRLEDLDHEPVGGELLRTRRGRTRGWLKVQDGCDRKCAFCATRLARGASRSRTIREVVAEARGLALHHPELVITGIHIGHYGRDLGGGETLAGLLSVLQEQVPAVRFRLGSVEATEIDEPLIRLLEAADGRVVPHLHMPLQSGADPVLRRMRRWHTREQVRARALELGRRLPRLGLGADVITGFPGETAEDHAATRALIEELPYTYLHVFPFSARQDTVAASLPDPVPPPVAAERARDLRELALAKGLDYRAARLNTEATVVVEGGDQGLTEDYLRVRVSGKVPTSGVVRGALRGSASDLYIEASPNELSPPSAAH